MDGKTGELLALLMDIKNQFRQPRKLAPHPRSNEHALLHMIAHAQSDGEPVGISQLSRMMRVTQPTITQSVQLLVEKGLVERTPDPNDRRAVCLRLTPKGEESRARQHQQSIAFLQTYVAYLGDEDVEHMMRILRRTQAFLETHGEEWEDTMSPCPPSQRDPPK